jgi:hypothetical protein
MSYYRTQNTLGRVLSVGLAVASLVTFLAIWALPRTVSNIQFDRNCGGYLERAANANSIELASAELAKALSYMEREQLTSGYTSIVYTTPDEDIGFWYTNIKTSHEELVGLSPDATSLEKSNVLMKLRETLTASGDRGSTSLVVPEGISIHPLNTLFAVIATLSTIGFIVGVIWVINEYD